MSEFLFAHPSFLSGVARSLDLSGSFDAYNDSETPEEADARAARSDWMSTGRDMRNAMDDGSNRVDVRQQLLGLIDEARHESHPIEYDLDTLFDRVHAPSMARLALRLGELVHRGQIQLLYRVVSPLGGGLGDFTSPDKIPPTIEDRFNDWQPLAVTPDRVVPIYRFPCARSTSR